MDAPEHADAIVETELRVKHGIKRELLPLIRLRGIGRVRARRLFNNNITSPEALRSAGMERVGAILGQKTAESIFAQLNGPEGDAGEDDDDGRGQKTLSHF